MQTFKQHSIVCDRTFWEQFSPPLLLLPLRLCRLSAIGYRVVFFQRSNGLGLHYIYVCTLCTQLGCSSLPFDMLSCFSRATSSMRTISKRPNVLSGCVTRIPTMHCIILPCYCKFAQFHVRLAHFPCVWHSQSACRRSFFACTISDGQSTFSVQPYFDFFVCVRSLDW